MLNQTWRGGTLKDFQVIGKLGEGSFSQVFKVKRLEDGEEYAMKKVKIQLMKDKEKENALNEVRFLACLSDQYIVGYKEAFIDNNELYVIMEFCPLGDIQKMISDCQKRRTQIEEKEIWKALIDMLNGTKCLHQMKILHRDIKCANVFINKDGVYKLGDLNVSKFAKKGLVYTQTGTPYYAAPEVWKDTPYDQKCDIWSIGCVVYEMAALSPPFKAIDMQGLNRKIQKGNFDRIPYKYSNDLQQIIQMCLKVQPSQRPNAEQLLIHPLIQKFSGNNPDQPAQEQQQLLQTIKCPRNLGQLKEKLPKARYNIKRNKSYVETPTKIEEQQISEQKSDSNKKRTRIYSAGTRPPVPAQMHQKRQIEPIKAQHNIILQEKQQQIPKPNSRHRILSKPTIENHQAQVQPYIHNQRQCQPSMDLSPYQQKKQLDNQYSRANIQQRDKSPLKEIQPRQNSNNMQNDYRNNLIQKYHDMKTQNQQNQPIQQRNYNPSPSTKNKVQQHILNPNTPHKCRKSRPYSAYDISPKQHIQNYNEYLNIKLQQKQQNLLDYRRQLDKKLIKNEKENICKNQACDKYFQRPQYKYKVEINQNPSQINQNPVPNYHRPTNQYQLKSPLQNPVNQAPYDRYSVDEYKKQLYNRYNSHDQIRNRAESYLCEDILNKDYPKYDPSNYLYKPDYRNAIFDKNY